MPSEPKILLALQFWEGDKRPAMEVARLIADLEPSKGDVADFLFISRFDCTLDQNAIEYVSRKFNVFSRICPRRGVGWPHGCNELWLGTMEWIYRMKEASKIPQYKAVLTFEADSAPTRPGWIQHFSSEWDRAKAQMGGKLVSFGPMLPNGPAPGIGHINGNAMFSCDIVAMRKIVRQVSGTHASIGWDYYHAPFFKELGWADFPAIKSLYNTPTLSEDAYNREFGSGTYFIHGVKDASLRNIVRRKFL